MNRDIANTMLFDADYTSGAALDTVGYEGCSLVLPVESGTSVAITESNDDVTYNDVAAKFIKNADGGALTGNDVAYTATGTGNIGCVSKKRYLKFTVTSAVSNTNITTVLGIPAKAPVTSV